MSIIGWADNIRKNFEEGEKQQIIDEKNKKIALKNKGYFHRF